MLNNNPLVSVVIPTYNRPDYLAITLNSVINQTYKNIEIIVIDDGTLGTENKQICNKLPNVKYIKIENSGGPATPRNIGISKSKGKYIGFVDDDDIWLSHKIETQVNILEKYDDFGLVHGCCNVMDENGIITGEIVGRPGNNSVKHGNVLMRMIGNWTLMMPTPLIRKTIINEVGLFNEKIPPALEDVEYWSRCAFHTKFYYLDQPLVNYRQHTNNISTNNKKYINLPLYLFQVIKVKQLQNIIGREESRKLILNICLMQSKMIKNNGLKTISNLFILNPFWVFNYRVLRVILKKMVS
tara:strand:+ start:3014 stop:3907 length:894 start_codon:yes stop_codon:yes gene_type:complete